MNKLESIKERLKVNKSAHLAHNNPFPIKDMVFSFNNDADVEYLLQRLERYEKALKEYKDEPYLKSIGYTSIAEEALKEE